MTSREDGARLPSRDWWTTGSPDAVDVQAGPVDFEFSLPWPPTTGQEWIPVRRADRARLILSPDARQYRRDVALELMVQRVPRMGIAFPCALHMFAQGPTTRVNGARIGARAYDVGNLEKATLDALKHSGLLADDRWIDDIRITRGEQVDRGRLYLRIRRIAA